ncbi:MAG: hypothetical protein JXA74_05670, partial [Anaerolineae bacterium]|nr:hypothetical protein [Anaerolineae bacterium]
VVGRRPHMPSSQVVAESSAFDVVKSMFPGFDQFLAKYYDAPRYTFPPKVPIAEYYISRFGAWRDRAMLLEMTPQQALDGCQEEVMKEMANYEKSK